MLSSHTLEDRNEDPKPWVAWPQSDSGLPPFRAASLATIEAIPHREKMDLLVEKSPRPEFQYGVLPGNPILVGFCEAIDSGEYQSASLATVWACLLATDYDFTEDVGESTQSDRVHAYRVLALLSHLAPEIEE